MNGQKNPWWEALTKVGLSELKFHVDDSVTEVHASRNKSCLKKVLPPRLRERIFPTKHCELMLDTDIGNKKKANEFF